MKKINSKNILSVLARGLMITNSFKSKQKIVVIESDDWGGIRTSNRNAFEFLKNNGYDLSKSAYSLDCLESNEDLEMLFSTLESIEFNQGQKAKITGNVILGNPDFKSIKDSGFQDYAFESVEKTIDRYKESANIINLWKNGLHRKLFKPQLHGREHIRYWEWLVDLQNNYPEALDTFEHEMCGVPLKVSKSDQSYFKPLYICQEVLSKNRISLDQLITDGSRMFETLFSYKSSSTVAPNVAWTKDSERIWKKNNIDIIQGGFLQEIHCKKRVKYKAHYTGKRNELNQIYTVRNCTFEPVKSDDQEYWKSTYKQIERAFTLKTPAIISTHRVNYVGGIDKTNRERGLLQLDKLLRAIQKNHPDVIFMSSDELGSYIMNNKPT